MQNPWVYLTESLLISPPPLPSIDFLPRKASRRVFFPIYYANFKKRIQKALQKFVNRSDFKDFQKIFHSRPFPVL